MYKKEKQEKKVFKVKKKGKKKIKIILRRDI